MSEFSDDTLMGKVRMIRAWWILNRKAEYGAGGWWASVKDTSRLAWRIYVRERNRPPVSSGQDSP